MQEITRKSDISLNGRGIINLYGVRLLIYTVRIINPSVIEAVFPDSLNTIYGLPQFGIRQRSVVCEESGTNYLSMLLCTD